MYLEHHPDLYGFYRIIYDSVFSRAFGNLPNILESSPRDSHIGIQSFSSVGSDDGFLQ